MVNATTQYITAETTNRDVEVFRDTVTGHA